MKETINANDNLPDYQDWSAVWTILGVCGLLTLIAAMFMSAYNENVKLYNQTCDEIAIKLSDTNYYQGKYYEKCMKDIFPNKYPTDVQLQQYFINMDCVSLGTHILKSSFEYLQATPIYEIKCSTPLQHLELPPVIIEQTPELEIKYKLNPGDRAIDAHLGQSNRYRD